MLEWVFAALTALSCNDAVSPTIVAHRGGMDSGFPENTLPAFRHAASAGAHAIELDLRATRDGRVVVLHDPRVDRTTDGRGYVHQLTASALEHLDTGDGIRVPSLREVLEDARTLGVELLFDIKPAPRLDLEVVVTEAAEHHRLDGIIFGVRSLDDHARLTLVQPDLRFLGFVPSPEHIEAFLHAGVEIVRLWPQWLARQPELVEHVHQAGARVWVTAGKASVDELSALAALGVDGLLTDRPGDAVAALHCR